METDKDPCELTEASELLKFSTLFPSLLSSLCSLAYGQYITHAIAYKHKTSGKQELIYLGSCVMNTMCNMCILLTWQTVAKDVGVGHQVDSESSFHFDDLSVLTISMMLLTPILYRFMVLPPSTKNYMPPSMKTPKFLDKVKNQCIVYSFYLGLAGFFNSWLYTWATYIWEPTLPEVAFNITNNETYLGKNCKFSYAKLVIHI